MKISGGKIIKNHCVCSLNGTLFFHHYFFEVLVNSIVDSYLTSQQPPDQTNAVRRFVIAWNGDVHETQGRISVAQGNNRDVHIRRLGDGLMIDSWIGDDQETRLTESRLDLIGKGTWNTNNLTLINTIPNLTTKNAFCYCKSGNKLKSSNS